MTEEAMSTAMKQTRDEDLLSKVFRVANEVVYVCVLSLVWLIASLPIVTMGAATAGVYAVLLSHMKDGNREYLRPFWRTFRASWIAVTLPSVLLLGLMGLTGFNVYYYVTTGSGGMGWVLALIQALVAVACSVVLTYYLAAAGRHFSLGLAGTAPAIPDALREIRSTPLPSLVIAAVTVAVPAFFVITGLWQFALFAVGLIAYGNSWVLSRRV